jgi:hypothetical protein
MTFLTDMPILTAFLESIVFVLLSAGVLHGLKRMGEATRPIRAMLSRAPALDLVIFWFTTVPPVAAWVFSACNGRSGWVIFACIAAATAGQIVGLYIWSFLHELANRSRMHSPRLIEVVNRNLSSKRGDKPTRISLVGRMRNHFALNWTLWAVPMFNIVRLAEVLVYPALIRVARLPRYKQAEWVNVSRHKVDGLVGHDLIWCLYCDWMTGVWSLGSEMLRNVESFWCPIRFASPEKCANCAHDFPDIEHGWIRADQPATAAAEVVANNYPAPDGSNAWFGHPVRVGLTVEGKKS